MKKNSDIDVIVISPLGYTGLAYYDYSLCSSLCEHGIGVELYTSDRWFLDTKKNKFKTRTLYKNCSGDVPKIIKGMHYILSTIRIAAAVFKNKARIIHFQILELPFIDLFLMVILKINGRKLIYTPHDILHNKNFMFNRITASCIYRLVDRIVAHKESNLNNLIREFHISSGKVRIIPHGNYEYFIDADITKKGSRQQLGYQQDYKIILFFGNIKPSKGLEVLIKAVSLLKNELEDLKLVIAGRVIGKTSKRWIAEILDKENIADITVTNLEFIPNDLVIYYYMASDLIILPYTEVYESGVLKLAQTCGKVVICSELEEFKDTVIHGETGYFFKNGDYNDLAKQIKNALLNKNLEEIGRNAKKLMKDRYGWDEIADLTKNMYREIAANKIDAE